MVPREVDWNKPEHAFPAQNIDHPLCSLSDEDFVLEKLLPSFPKKPQQDCLGSSLWLRWTSLLVCFKP